MWKSGRIICLKKANNVQNHFTCFWNYTQEEVMNMRKLDLILAPSHVAYLHTILEKDTNKVLNYTLDLGKFKRWVG